MKIRLKKLWHMHHSEGVIYFLRPMKLVGD
jgi:hypothetical protein